MKGILIAGVLLGMIMLVSLTPQAYAASNNDQAIIVKGHQTSQFQHNTELSYKELNESRNLSADDIQYLDGNTSSPGFDALANKTNLNQSIDNATARIQDAGCKGNLTIYISTHGGDNGTPGDTTDDYLRIGPDKLTGQELKAMIDKFRSACPGSQVVIVIQACHSGSFIDDLSAPNTTVITSSEPCKPSYGEECYGSAFSQPFWKNITDNATLTEAFKKAVDAVKVFDAKPPATSQTPLYDDNGDGVGHPAPLPNGGDGDRTKDLKIGENISTNSRPVIENKTPDQAVAPGTSMVLNVTATDDKNVTRVYGRVFAPDFDFCDPSNETCVWDPPTIEFIYAGGDLWQCNYTFGMLGDYYIMLLAEDDESSLSYEEWTDIQAHSPGVGGIVELPGITETPPEVSEPAGANYALWAAIVAGAVIGIIGTAWYIRRRRTKAI